MSSEKSNYPITVCLLLRIVDLGYVPLNKMELQKDNKWVWGPTIYKWTADHV